MTVGELLARIGSHEIAEWALIFDHEDAERTKDE
jgi:hypothetical protein